MIRPDAAHYTSQAGVAMITADTITDEQIRELRILMTEERIVERWPDGVGSMMHVTDLALQGALPGALPDPRCPTPAAIHRARTRCAKILNARVK